jgi:cellulose synthase operon protein C
MTIAAPQIKPLTSEQLIAIQDLYDRGLAVQAYELGTRHAPLALWQSAEGQVLAGRLAMLLGAPRLGLWMHRRAYREAPQNADACYFYALAIAHSQGGYAAWRWMGRHTLPGDPTPEILSAWHALVANIAGSLRDFETANTWMARAREASPESVWVRVCEASLREAEDRYDEALAVAQEALAIKPWFRPAVQSVTHLLTLMGRDQEALAMLREADQRVESGALAAQQYAIELELQEIAAAERSLNRFEALSPMLEKRGRQWLAAQRADVAYRQNNIEAAIGQGRASDQDYWKAIAERLENPALADAKKALLPVGFVRQHHLTCVPATLASISRFWSMPSDHLQVAEEICYNGTSHYHERKWAREHGWIPREFSVTAESTSALIDRGIPFTFTTIDPGNAHLQAIIGYDDRRGTLSVRDPYFRNSGEALTDKLLERYRAHGPRGMMLVPAAEEGRLAGLELPDAELWDRLHALDGMLDRHERESAGQVVSLMQNEWPGHRLALEARRRLAIYDGNTAEHLAAVNELAAQFPENQTLQYERLTLLRDLAHRDERLAIYEGLLAKKETHPIFWQQYAQELRPDARRHDDAIWRLRRAIRRWPMDAANYYLLAGLYWDHRRFDEALELYRIAACLGDKSEAYLESFFRAACWYKRSEEVLALLRDRAKRFGKQSSRPAMSLASALMELERTTEAFGVLEEAIAARPDDGDLLLYAADLFANSSIEHLPRARALVEAARGKSQQGYWLRISAKMQRNEGNLRESLLLWRQVLAAQPLAIDAHRAVARLLAETDSPAAALEYLEEAAARLPHFYPLHQLWVESVREEPADVREPVLRGVAAAFPYDAWIQRELGFFLADHRRLNEAREAASIAERLEPTSPSQALLTATMHRAEGQFAEARAVLEAAIERGVDNDYAIRELVELCATPEERRTALALIKRELTRQVTFGDGLLSYREQARGTLDPAELLGLLSDALAARPDLWHAWSAVIRQHVSMNELDAAWSLVQQATERFPLLPALWLDRAAVCRARHAGDAELDALRAVHRINPRWNLGVQGLADCLERRGEYAAAREILERAVSREPLDGMLRGLWAEALWRDGQREKALGEVERLVQIDPGYERAWDLLSEWSKTLNCPEKALASVRELTARRSGEARSWMLLARLLDKPEQLDERLAALDKAIELTPRNSEAHDQRAHILAQARRWDDALAACRPAVFGEYLPLELRWRAAWIEAQRGNVAEAIEGLRALVAIEPRYFPGWSLLADCYAQIDQREGYLEAAQALVALNPQYEVSLGYLGEARQLNGDLQGAEEAYRRAFTLNPQYEFAGNALFDLQVERGDLAAAEETIKTLRAHSEAHYVLARESRLATLLGDTPRAAALVSRMATEPTQDPRALHGAVHSLVQAGQADAAERALEAVLYKPEANFEAAEAWVWVRRQRGQTVWNAPLVELLGKNQSIGERATYAYIDALAQASEVSVLKQFVKKNESWLRANDCTWGSVAYGFTTLRDYSAAARWANDWRERPAAEPWMLVNVMEGFRGVGRTEEAREVSAAALTKPADNGTALHNIWLASDAAAEGDAASAALRMAEVNVATLDLDYLFLATCAQKVIDMAQAAPEEAAAVFWAARGQLKDARRSYPQLAHEPARRVAFRRCLMQLGRLRGTWLARFLCWVERVMTF